jgi:hypothetical protein
MQQVWVSFVFDCPASEGGQQPQQGYAIWSDEDGWYFDVDTDSTLIGRQYCIRNELLPCTITHWMPLPESPQ